MKWLVSIFLFTSLPTQSIQAQTYLLSPHGEKSDETSSLPLKKADEKAWLTKTYQFVSLISAAETKSEVHQSIEQKLKSASQTYFETDSERTSKILDEALEILSTSFPYAEMTKDAQRIAALKVMTLEAHEEMDLPEEAKAFTKDPQFLKNLSYKSQTRVQSYHSESSSVTPGELGIKGNLRVWIYGEEIKFPIHLQHGRYLVQVLSEDSLQTYWLTATSKFEMQKLWGKPIWFEVPLANLITAMEKARPRHLPKAGITVLAKKADGKVSPLYLRATTAVRKADDPTTMQKRDPWEEADRFESRDDSSIFRSPWFWGAVAIGAGISGYFIYDSTQSKRITTP